MWKALYIFVATATLASVTSQEEATIQSSDGISTKAGGGCDDDKVTSGPPKNERWVECPPILCVPATCDDLGKALPCPRIAPGKCPKKPAYVCIEGYVRDKDGVCIKKQKCPSCSGDPNAVAGCSFLCSARCSTNGSAPTRDSCQSFRKKGLCEANGCQCKSGFVYDGIKNKCVRPTQCTKSCPKNEVYTSCANGGCGKWNCTQIDQPILCIDPIRCIGGCICKKDYLRGKDGKCIPQGECRKNLCPNPNEVYDSCPLACPPRKCGIDDRAVLCMSNLPCEPAGCRCEDGTYRNSDGICVPWDECPPVTNSEVDKQDDANSKEPTSTTVSPSECPDNLEQLLIDANANLTGQFLYNSMKSNPGENLIMSAFSLFTPIGELAYFSQGETLRQFLSVLNLSSKEYIRCVFPPLLKRLSAEENVILNMAARIFTTDAYPLTQKFVDYTKDVFDAVPESLDFSDGEASAKRINEWAANATNNRITDIASPSIFTADTRLILANAIYFLGNWVHQFDGNNTEDRDFYVSKDQTVQIPTMYEQNSFKYGESPNLNAKVLEMYYKGGNFSFMILLPNEIDGLEQLVEKVKDPAVFYEAYDGTSYNQVQVYLPKVKVETKHDLADVMKSAGLTDVFSPAASNLTDILQVFQPLHISAASQKAFALIDEKGTEAAAVNLITVGVTSVMIDPPKIYVFNCDRPFAFYILYGRIPIFSGIFAKPNPTTN